MSTRKEPIQLELFPDKRRAKRDQRSIRSLEPSKAFSRCKTLFDFIRNMIICTVVIFSSYYVEYVSFVEGERRIFYSKAFQSLAQKYEEKKFEDFLIDTTSYEISLYFAGFKANRVWEPLEASEFENEQELYERLELLRLIRKRQNEVGADVSNWLLVLGYSLLLYNALAFARHASSNLTKRRFINALSGLVVFLALGVVSMAAVYLTTLVRQEGLYSSEASKGEIMRFALRLGLNEYTSIEMERAAKGIFD